MGRNIKSKTSVVIFKIILWTVISGNAYKCRRHSYATKMMMMMMMMMKCSIYFRLTFLKYLYKIRSNKLVLKSIWIRFCCVHLYTKRVYAIFHATRCWKRHLLRTEMS